MPVTNPAATVSLSALQRAGAKQGVVDLIEAPPMPKPPVLAYSATGSTSVAALIASGYSTLGTDATYVAWYNDRIACLGGGKFNSFDVGFNDAAGRNQFTCHSYPSTGDLTKGFRGGALAYYAVDLVCSEFEFIIHDTTNQWFRVFIDGQPHTATRVNVAPGAGTPAKTGPIWTVHVSGLPRGRDRYTVMVECDSMLFGGFVHRKTDSLLEPTGLGTGPAMLVVGDSYSVAENLEARYSWAWQLACLFGIERVYISGTGGTGIASDNVLNGGTTGYKYRDRLVARRADIPNDVVLIVNQGSTNDGAFSTGTAPLDAGLASSCQSLWDYQRAQWPSALVVQTTTMRCKTPTAADSAANVIYRAQVALRSDVLLVDQETAGWFSGTGTSAAPNGTGNSDTMIQTDASHPTIVGQDQIARRLAAAVSSLIVAPARASVRSRNQSTGHAGIITPDPAMGATAGPTITAGRAYFNRIPPQPERVAVTGVACVVQVAATANDAVHVAIFDRLGLAPVALSGAVTGKLNPGTVPNIAVIPITATLEANTVYYVGLVCPTIGGTGATVYNILPSTAGVWQILGAACPNVICCQQAGVTTFTGLTIVPAFLTAQNPILAIRTD